MDNRDLIESLNDLIQITEDSHDGYRRSADDAQDGELKSLFNDLASQRGAMVNELQDLVRQKGGQPEDSGTILASAHRFFVDLKTAVTGQDRAAILREIERGEGEAIRRHENVLSKADLPADVATVVRRHLERFQADRARMTVLKRASG